MRRGGSSGWDAASGRAEGTPPLPLSASLSPPRTAALVETEMAAPDASDAPTEIAAWIVPALCTVYHTK